MRRGVLIAVVAVALVAVAVLGLRRAPEATVPTATVERRAMERIIVASGTVEPEDLVEVRSKVSGFVQRFHVAAGDRVTAGQVVAEIDRDTLEAAVREARAAVREAELTRDLAALELSRRERTFAGGVEPREVLDRVRTEHARALAAVDRMRAALERLEQELAWATIAAPIAGLVLERELNPGAAVASVVSVTGGTVLMTIADTSALHVKGVVDENEIGRVRVGMPARIRTEAFPERTFTGRVRKIAPVGTRKNNVTSFTVEVTVLDGLDVLVPRMSADADVVAEVHEGALALPEAALVYEGEQTFVERVDAATGRVTGRSAVQVGISQGDRMEILGGLAEGEAVRLQ